MKDPSVEQKEAFGEKDLKESETSATNEEKFVVLKNINKFYEKDVHAVIDFNLEVKKHEFVVLVGPSGCGKSTTLRMIAGLEEISSGELYIDNVYSNDLTPKARDIAMVFQSYSLYPNMSVYDNLAFSLKVSHLPQEEIDKRVNEAAKILEIENLLNRKPKALSGGQRQRVALGRAIVRKAKVFLMDEPLSNLDAKLRVQMRSEIINLHRRIHATTIYVTHDQIEAMTMADRIVVMKDGYVQQIGTPMTIYRHPANYFVASFIGSPAMNFITATYDKGNLIFPQGPTWQISPAKQAQIHQFYQNESEREDQLLHNLVDFIESENKEKMGSKHAKITNPETDPDVLKIKEHLSLLKKILAGEPTETVVGVRPEDIVESQEPGSFVSEVFHNELLGDECYVHLHFGEKEVISKLICDTPIEIGKKIPFEIREEKAHLFDYLTGKTII